MGQLVGSWRDMGGNSSANLLCRYEAGEFGTVARAGATTTSDHRSRRNREEHDAARPGAVEDWLL
jgi:hypothetical protein